MQRMQQLCRQLKPVLGARVDRLWAAWLAESEPGGKAEIEQVMEMLAAKHLHLDYQPDRSPFPPPPRQFAGAGDIPLGQVAYAGRDLFPFHLRSGRLKEHLLIAGRSGSGKTNLTFILLDGIMARGIKVLALDWKRGYRDLRQLYPDLRIYTIGRDVSPFRFNPLIPPPGCEPQIWIKLIVETIASAYLGGEGVISLLVAGLDHLYAEAHEQGRWPTIMDLLAWLRSTKLKGRAAMWQASAERILLAMTYGEFGAVVNTQDNSHLQGLLDHNVVLEMDGLSSASDRVMFSESLTLYLYRYRLSQGPQPDLTNVIVLEEAHNLLLAKQAGSKESILENSIRMVRQYGLGYVFVDQSASLLSKVAFANSYATVALSQKLRSDVQAISSAMNLTDEQKEALNTLPIGTAVVRLADEFPEPFLVRVPRCPIKEGAVTDDQIRSHMGTDSTLSTMNSLPPFASRAIPALPSPDTYPNKNENNRKARPPSPTHIDPPGPAEHHGPGPAVDPPKPELTREMIRFLADVAGRPLATTVSRYERLSLSRRRGNAIRKDLVAAGLVEPVPLATRSGQIILYQLTGAGRSVCERNGIDTGPRPRASLEHIFWTQRVAEHYEGQGYEIRREYRIDGNGAIDLLAENHHERLAIEIETGKSDITENLRKLKGAGFKRIILLATSPAAVTACKQAIDGLGADPNTPVDLMTWLDLP
jgi:hypothetical protein